MSSISLYLMQFVLVVGAFSGVVLGAAAVGSEPPSASLQTGVDLSAARESGRGRSLLLRQHSAAAGAEAAAQPTADLEGFKNRIAPLLQRSCVPCHGPDQVEGNIRIDTLNPDLLHGPDVSWWLEISSVVARAEMPPPDAEGLADTDRAAIIEWLSGQLRAASELQRASQGGSAFRRLTRYELNYALQDLLGLPFDFARDLPPEPFSKEGFQNSAELLQMSAAQLELCREAFRRALERSTVRGAQPRRLFWSCAMQAASADEWAAFENQQQKLREQHAADPSALQTALADFHKQHSRAHGGPYYLDPQTGLTEGIRWDYGGAKYAWPPLEALPQPPALGDARPSSRPAAN